MLQQLGQSAAIVGRTNNERATQRAWPNVGGASLKGEGLRSHGEECSGVKWYFVSYFVLVSFVPGMDCRAGTHSWEGPWLYPGKVAEVASREIYVANC